MIPTISSKLDTLCGAPSAAGLSSFLECVLEPARGWGAPELSISLSSERPPRARALVQTLETGANLGVEDLCARLERASSWFAARAGCPISAGKAVALMQRLYVPPAKGRPRLGLGVECDAAGPAGLRLYLDMFAQGPERAAAARDLLLDLLGLRRRFASVWLALAGPGDSPVGRILGLDLPAGGSWQAKLYLPARRVGAEAILRAAGRLAPGADQTLCRLLSILGGGCSPLDAASTLLALSIHADPAAPVSPKLDFQLADFVRDDAEAQEKIEAILSELGLDAPAYRRATEIALEGVPPGQSAGVHQYLSVCASVQDRHKAAVYFRPVSSGADRLPRRSRPRRKHSAIDSAIQRAVDRLEILLADRTLWTDFQCSIGESDEWVTAFVLAQLADVPGAARLLDRCRPALASRQRPDGGWGYNARVASDCDSTAWALLALTDNSLSPANRERACLLLLEHQAPSGGFATYRPTLRPRDRTLRAKWFEPQPCVTSAAALALARSPGSAYRLQISRALAYLETALIESCWWPHPAYVVEQINKALALEIRPPRSPEPVEPTCAFHDAWLLCTCAPRNDPAARELTDHLLATQRPDGSWPPAEILRIPDDRPGVITVSMDHKATFATAAAAHALAGLAARHRQTPPHRARGGSTWPATQPASPPGPAYIFGAQGAQWPGMGRDLLHQDPAFSDAIADCDREISRQAGWSLREQLIAPPSRYRLDTDPRHVQPGLTALQIGLVAALSAQGIHPRAVGALSMGEAAAAYCAGAITLPEAIRIACCTARLAETALPPAAMAFLRLAWDDVGLLLRAFGDRAAPAVELGSNLTVIAGDRVAVQAVLTTAADRGIVCGTLTLPQAYHTPTVHPLRAGFEAGLGDLRPLPVALPLYSSVVGRRHYPAESTPRHWWAICSAPSRFYSLSRAMVADGYRLFVEIGPHPMLMQSILDAASADGVQARVYAAMERNHGATRFEQTAEALRRHASDVAGC